MKIRPLNGDAFTLMQMRRRASVTALVLAGALALAIGTPPATAVDAAGPAKAPAPAAAPAPTPNAPQGDALPSDGPTYPISSLSIEYLRANPLHPSVESALQVSVVLGQTPTGFVAPREGLPNIEIVLADINDRATENYHASGLQQILLALRDFYVAQDLLGVFAAPDPRQITEAGSDLRARGITDLTILITTGIVDELRTAGGGDRVAEGGEIEPTERINHPLHARILANSPVQPYMDGADQRIDLLKRSSLDRYLFHLGRHPGRRVDASVAAASEPGGIALDYQIQENRPFVLYAQVSNTGTEATNKWRERVGFVHSQFTDYDDILSLDFSTANFDEVNALSASYERPMPQNDRIRWRVDASWSEFNASEVGFFNDTFEGDSWSLGGGIVANVYQDRELFVDLLAGVRFEHIRVNNPFIPEGEEDFLFPYIGVRYDRTTEWFSTQATATLEWQSDLTDVDPTQLSRLGRTAPDKDWVVLRWNASHSVYLEPWLDRAAWEDPSTPESSTLAHELLFSFRGQHAFDNRLIPQAEGVVGGLYTVRGYPESVIAGDSTVIGTLEYRFHLPRAYGVEAEPGELFGETFRSAPQYVYGVPDWDLVLKGFFDIGRVTYSNNLFFESDETLMGAGIGVELLYRRNMNIRLDWGFALDDLTAGNVNSGSNRLHVVGTFLF